MDLEHGVVHRSHDKRVKQKGKVIKLIVAYPDGVQPDPRKRRGIEIIPYKGIAFTVNRRCLGNGDPIWIKEGARVMLDCQKASLETWLRQKRYQVRVYNRTEQKAAPIIAAGAKWIDSPGGVVEPGGIVFTMLADDAAVESIAVGNPDFLDRFAGGGIHISMSTIAPQTARDLAEQHAKKGVAYLAAPVIGRPDRAAAGSLFILLAGESNAKKGIEPLLKNLGQRIFDFGEKPWQANIAKLILNFNIAAAIECMAEAFTLAEKEGIPRLKMAELLSETLFSSVVYKGYGDFVARHQYDPAGFRLRLGWKDLRLVLQVAQESETPMPIGSLLGDRFLSALAKHRGDLDWSAVALGASDDAGLQPLARKSPNAA